MKIVGKNESKNTTFQEWPSTLLDEIDYRSFTTITFTYEMHWDGMARRLFKYGHSLERPVKGKVIVLLIEAEPWVSSNNAKKNRKKRVQIRSNYIEL